MRFLLPFIELGDRLLWTRNRAQNNAYLRDSADPSTMCPKLRHRSAAWVTAKPSDQATQSAQASSSLSILSTHHVYNTELRRPSDSVFNSSVNPTHCSEEPERLVSWINLWLIDTRCTLSSQTSNKTKPPRLVIDPSRTGLNIDMQYTHWIHDLCSGTPLGWHLVIPLSPDSLLLLEAFTETKSRSVR